MITRSATPTSALFLTHLVVAIQTAEPEAGVDALTLLEAGGATPTDSVL